MKKLLLGMLLVSSFFISSDAFADPFYSQADVSQNGAYNIYQNTSPLGAFTYTATEAGTIDSNFWIAVDGVSGGSFGYQSLYFNINKNGVTQSTPFVGGLVVVDGFQWLHFTGLTGFSVSPGDVIEIAPSAPGGAFGSIAYLVGASASIPNISCENSVCPPPSAPAFQLGGSSLPPSGDGDLSSHIIRINTPEVGSTTASTFPINFDYENNLSSSPVSQYTIDFSPASGIGDGSFVEMTGTLNPSQGGAIEISTTSPALPDGSYLMRLSLESPLVGSLSANIGSKLVTFSVNVNQLVGVPGFDGTTTNYIASSTACAVSLSWNLGSCFTYLFIPSPNMFAAYGGLSTALQGKIPFSYVYSIANTWQGLTASTTANSPTMDMNLHDIGLGSTTPMGNILPNFTYFSASTTEQYFPAGSFNLLKDLASIALILGLFADIFFTTRNLIKT